MRVLRAGLIVATAVMALSSTKAAALSPGCAALNDLAASNVPFPILDIVPVRELISGAGLEFDATDVIRISLTSSGVFASPAVIDFGFADGGTITSVSTVFDDAGQTTALSVQAPAAGKFKVFFGINGSFAPGDSVGGTVLTCLTGAASGGGAAETRQQSQAATAARTSFVQQSGLVFSRTNSLILNKPQNRAGGPDLGVSALPQGGMLGGVGQGSDSFGVWGDFTWSGLQNDDAVSGADANAFTLSAGYDAPITDRLIAGAAVSVGGAIFDLKNSNAETSEINFGVTPYIAYQLDDVFALQAAAGYTHARGSSDVTGDDGDYGVNRYFLAGEASAFQTWDEFALFGSVGVLWGQSFQARYTDDTGNRAGSVRTQLGSVSVTAQPSYLFTVDEAEGVFIEPYLLGQYSYDFSQTKTRGAANDADEFLVGAGANAFHGNGMSGALEFTRTLGREDQAATSARATVRMDF